MAKMIPFDFFNRYAQILKPLGLSEYETRVFLTLLMSGPLNYRVLVRESSVPTGKIYQVLATLESKGFIEVVQEKPKVFKAAEPKKALRRRLRQLEDDFLELELKTKEALLSLQSQYNLKYDIIQGLVSEIFVGSKSFGSRIQENLAKAESEVLISWNGPISGLDTKTVFGELLGRGVPVRAMFPSAAVREKSFLSGLSELGVNVRLLEILPSEYVVVDEKNVSLIIEGSSEPTCVQIHGSGLCRVLRERFTEDWEKSKPFKGEKISPAKILSSFRLFE
jgi:sugar-specific transcriptional regulator TrmB